MSGGPLVSVIIIFLNEERFIEEAIESVFSQTYRNWELLLVDDGSTDTSVELARRYAGREPGRVRILHHDGHRNLGMSASRNLGVREAGGEYVAFLDANDMWLPDKLERQVADLERNPEAVMVYGPTRYWFSWTGLLEDSTRDFVPALGVAAGTLVRPPALLTICYPLGKAPAPATCSFLIRRKAFETVGGFEDSFRGLCEDQAFLAKVHLKASAFVSGDCLSLYRMHPDSCCFTSIRTGQHEAGIRTLLDWLGDYLRKEGVTDQTIWTAFHKAQLPYRYPRLTRLLGWASELVKRAGRKRSQAPKEASSGAIQVSITACPNPVIISGPFADRFPVGTTTLSWTADTAAEVEVHIDAPDGPLLSRTAGAGKAATGNWVRDGTAFYLQDITGGKPLVPEHTLAVTKVKVAARPREPAPPVGRVRFGSLRRLEPISAEWGFDRGLPVDRHYIENFLASHASDVRGRTLEIGDDAYTRRFGGSSVVRSDVLNLREGIPGTTIVGDLAGAPQIPSGTFDCVILTQTLQCIYDVRAAVRTLHRILKPAGVVLATVPGISQTYDPHWHESWCWNFTPLSARRLFEEAFSPAQVEIGTFGNVFAALCFLEGIAAEELRPEELEYRDPGYVVTIGIRAVKLGVEG